jgi:hypothetical protein
MIQRRPYPQSPPLVAATVKKPGKGGRLAGRGKAVRRKRGGRWSFPPPLPPPKHGRRRKRVRSRESGGGGGTAVSSPWGRSARPYVRLLLRDLLRRRRRRRRLCQEGIAFDARWRMRYVKADSDVDVVDVGYKL